MIEFIYKGLTGMMVLLAAQLLGRMHRRRVPQEKDGE